ncbi:xylulose 5-phosphate 3-epimerase [Endozoicomonas sp. SM1973]|uniref:Xylulose 5-phosphate 3-epimerase n=1 Tax=Spartinivicinus marinus TaxID=2994442 RepID=A0A853I077_9GAMM|nr:xylulose 5-phosphate 3-epimerase [Spartinivicinus marinus]MCX4025288.1 xylulose 5-phosphate 3-epimerase [Spartinivicinus marinus]NYZ66009.1 xylulose 5-phosphate 3-epimerase [Spartinivicinus marinus]
MIASNFREDTLIEQRATLIRNKDKDFANWASGYGVIKHTAETQLRIYEMVCLLVTEGVVAGKTEAYQQLAALDKLTCAAMWLVVHMTYAKNVYLDGKELTAADFKRQPQGHTGGSLNMVTGYMGYMGINALTGMTRQWLMGQGHCVAAIDAVNLLLENTTAVHKERYDWSDQGLTRFVRDFYSYLVNQQGKPVSPLGSHVNTHTAGATIEGGYLGFAGLYYVHQPMPGERLVAFLSDGAFEEQRGSDWAPRWWRAEDTGLVTPIMIANGRRIDQRTTMSQSGGSEWFKQHLALNYFDPVVIDGTDPAAFVWAIFEMENRLQARAEAVKQGKQHYPIKLPYVIAETVKGYGFPGAGTNAAHGTPLQSNPAKSAEALMAFNQGAKKLWVPTDKLKNAVKLINNHDGASRPKENTVKQVIEKIKVNKPSLSWKPELYDNYSPMVGWDEGFTQLVKENAHLRVRVGNPDELRSNQMNQTLDWLKHRVTQPEQGVAEAIDGKVITALNEEAVVSAVLANQQGINLVVSYEAFAVKMLGALRQTIIFARHQKDVEQPASWLSVPVLSTSHVWENGKNEQSHQDPTLSEALMGEMSDMARVLFPCDWNSALATMQSCYASYGQIWLATIPKLPVPVFLSKEQSINLLDDGAVLVRGVADASIQLVAVGAYQLLETLKASDRLNERGISHSLIYIIEPGRFRVARDNAEAEQLVAGEVLENLFPATVKTRVFICHGRPEVYLGVMRQLDLGPKQTVALGYINQGGTLDIGGMFYANKTTWAHILYQLAKTASLNPQAILTDREIQAVTGVGDPYTIIAKPYQ